MTARTVKLRETDSLFVGKPSAVWLAGHGAFFVADRQNARVFQVDSAGTIARVLGRPGPGPGELEQPLQLVGLGDSALGVADETKKAIEIFTLSTGAFQRARPYEGLIMSVAVDGPTVWMGGVNPRHARGVKRWDLSTDSMTYLVPLPLPYQRSPPLASFFNTVLPKRCAVTPQPKMTWRAALMVAGSLALRKNMADVVPGLKDFLSILRSKLRIFIETSPKSISTGQGVRHL